MASTRYQRLCRAMTRVIAAVTSIAMWLSLSNADAIAQTDHQRMTDERLNAVDARVFAVGMLDTNLASSRDAAAAALTGSQKEFSDYVDTGRVEAQKQDLRHILTTISTVSGPTVQKEVAALLDSNDSAAMSEFIDSGWQNAQAQDDRASAWEAAQAPDGSTLKSAADEALQQNTPDALSEFAATGAETARAHDRRREVYELTNSPLPSVAAGASEAIQVGTDTAIEEFLRYGQFVAASQDSEKMEISQLVETAINEASAASTANKLAWQQADQAARAAESARRAAEISRDEALAADAAQTRAGNAASAAADLAQQSAHVADQAVAASQEARIALQQTADALSRAASAAGRARAAASAAQTAAANAAGDASAARGARIAAEQARDAAARARDSAEAHVYASQSAGHARAAGQAASSAAANADAAASAAADAANAAGVSEAAAAEAREGAARARAAAARARAAANEVDRLVHEIEGLVDQAGQAAIEAAEHAERSAEAADRAAQEAENSATHSRNAGEYAAEAQRAAEAANGAIDLAESAHELAVKIDDQRRQAEKEFLRTQAEDARTVQDAADQVAADEKRRREELAKDLAPLEGSGAPNSSLDVEAIKKATVAAAQVGSPAVVGAAKTALTGGTDDDFRVFATSGYPTAVDQDNQALLRQWWATDPNEDVRFDSGMYANAAPEVIDWFINDEVKTLRLPELIDTTWKLRETQGENTRAAADAALRDGGYDTLDDFVNGGGYDKARYSDQLQQAYHLVETGGPELKAAAEAAIVGDRKTLDEFITIEQYRRASLDANREAHNDHIDSMLATGRNIANLAGELASNAQAAYEYSQGSAQTARQYADAAAEYAGFAQQASQRAQEFAASAQQSLDFAKQQQARAHQAAASAAADAAEATANADQATSYAIDARVLANAAADSAISARASAAAAGQDAALAAQAADDAFRIAVEKELAEQAELQAGLDAQAVDGADPEKPASLLDIIKERIGPAALSLLLDLVGVTDLVNCFKGQISGCLWTLVGVIPAAKIAKAAPIVRRLISKTDEIVDALHSRKALKSRQLDEIRNLPVCPAFRPASYSPAVTFRPASYSPAVTFRPALQIRGAADLSLQTAARSKTCRILSTPDKPFRGGRYGNLGTRSYDNRFEYERHHVLAASEIRKNRDAADKIGLNPNNAPSIQMLPEDHAKTLSFRNLKGADEYRAKQGQLLREGKIDEIFQIEYDFLTGPEFGGRYNQALEETIDYALEKGFITKRPTDRLAEQATNT